MLFPFSLSVHAGLGVSNSFVNNQLPKFGAAEIQQATQAFQLRNEYKLKARELMIDQIKASIFPLPKNFRQAVKQEYTQSFTSDKLWQNLIDGAQRTNKAVDEKLGLKDTFAKPRNTP